MFFEEKHKIERLQNSISKCEREANRTGKSSWYRMVEQREQALIESRKDLLKKLISRKESYGRDYSRQSAAEKQFDRQIEEQRVALERLTDNDDPLTVEVGDKVEVEV